MDVWLTKVPQVCEWSNGGDDGLGGYVGLMG